MNHRIQYIFTAFAVFSSFNITCNQISFQPGEEHTKIIDAADLRTNISESKGHMIVLHYWGTWCRSCIAELKSLAALQEKYGDRGLRILAVSIDDPGDEKKLKLVKAAYLDSGRFYGQYISREDTIKIMTVVDTNFLEIIPLTYVLNQEGIVVRTYAGSRSFPGLSDYVNSVYR